MTNDQEEEDPFGLFLHGLDTSPGHLTEEEVEI